MDMYSHFLTGILIQIIILKLLPPVPAVWVLIFLITFLSHFLVDSFSFVTFHPDETYAQRFPDDKFYKIHNIVSALFTTTTIIIFVFITPDEFKWFESLFDPDCFFLVMLSSWFVDVIDWIIVRNLAKLKIISYEKYFKNGVMHVMINKFRAKFFSWIPNHRENKKLWIIEIILSSTLILLNFLLLN